MDKVIYKILTLPQWETLRASHSFAGSADDKRDGFIHLSRAGQVQATLDKHYGFDKTGGADLILAAVSAEKLTQALAQAHETELGSALKYEVSRGGQKFPHLFAPLSLSAISAHWALKYAEAEGYQLPKALLAKHANANDDPETS